MLEIHVTVSCPDLRALAEALRPAPAATQEPEPTLPAEPPTAEPEATTMEPPKHTVQEIAMAGAALIRDNPAMQPQLLDLLREYGAQVVTDLRAEQLDAFADALCRLGAKM